MENLKKTIYIVSLFLCLSATAFSQSISLEINNLPIKDAMEKLKEQTGYSFVFSSTDIDTDKRISISAKNATITSIVEQILQGQKDLTYEISDKKIILKKRQVPSKIPTKNNKTIGRVLDAKGEPIIGATVMEINTSNGTITDIDGKFSFNTQDNAIIEISFVGYQSQKIQAVNGKTLEITLQEDTEVLDEVVVTALGIKREKKALGYAMQEVKADAFSENRSTSVSNMLQGKVAGVQISQSAGGIGGSTRIILRGVNSLSGNNSPLWVVDGLPILDSSNGDYASGAADLNPDDIESISVLKGANAAALYGSRAQNGAIIVTTKKGKEGALSIEYNGYVSMSKAYDSYEFQDVYGQGTNGVYSMQAQQSWGPKMEGQIIPNWRHELYGDDSYKDYPMLPQTNQINDFFQTALNYVNSVSLSGGTDKVNARFSFTDSRNEGILPNEKLNKQNYNLNVEFKNKYITFGGKVTYFREKVKNKPSWNGGAWQQLIRMPRNIRLQDLQDPFGSDGYTVNWSGDSNDLLNPYQLLLDGNGNELNRNRFQGMLTLTGHITDYLKVTGRIGFDRLSDDLEQYAAYHNKAQSPANLIRITNSAQEEFNADLMVNFDKRYKDFSITANLGIAT